MGSLALFTTSGTKGLGSTAASTVCVPGVSPAGVLGLQPVGLCVMPNEIDPSGHADVGDVVPPPPALLPQADANRASSTVLVPTSHRQRRGRRPRPVTAAGDPG